MLRMQDFEVEGRVDWDAYQKAQVDAGEKCQECGEYIFASHGPTTCRDCRSLRVGQEEVTHNNSVRCPECRHVFGVLGGGVNDPHIAYDGDSAATCEQCEHRFTVRVDVSRRYTSPPLAGGMP